MSPTVSQDDFFLTSIINTNEGRDKAITDLKEAYLHANMKDEVLMKIIGKEVIFFVRLLVTPFPLSYINLFVPAH